MNALETHRRFTELVGRYVVFDPTGRDLPSCMVVGRAERVEWSDAVGDDGDAQGFPRPLLLVRVNGSDELVAVTVVAAVLA